MDQRLGYGWYVQLDSSKWSPWAWDQRAFYTCSAGPAANQKAANTGPACVGLECCQIECIKGATWVHLGYKPRLHLDAMSHKRELVEPELIARLGDLVGPPTLQHSPPRPPPSVVDTGPCHIRSRMPLDDTTVLHLKSMQITHLITSFMSIDKLLYSMTRHEHWQQF